MQILAVQVVAGGAVGDLVAAEVSAEIAEVLLARGAGRAAPAARQEAEDDVSPTASSVTPGPTASIRPAPS